MLSPKCPCPGPSLGINAVLSGFLAARATAPVKHESRNHLKRDFKQICKARETSSSKLIVGYYCLGSSTAIHGCSSCKIADNSHHILSCRASCEAVEKFGELEVPLQQKKLAIVAVGTCILKVHSN